MQSLKYIQYFFYLAYNWNVRIALHIIKNEIKGEKKYGINTTGADELKKLSQKGIDISHATIYMPASYDLLEEIFKHVEIKSFKHFVDIGCGKGRAMCVAAANGVDKITGIDFSKELCDAAAINLAKIKQHFPGAQYKITNNDAFYFEIPNDADCIFMFNPFDEIIMSGVINNIEESMEQNPREVTIIYLNPLQKHLFISNGYKEIFHTKNLHYLEGAIFHKKAPVKNRGF
ncbi:MAG: class I SAM-dependent methyltransferase [Ferruginibacter sp.]